MVTDELGVKLLFLTFQFICTKTVRRLNPTASQYHYRNKGTGSLCGCTFSLDVSLHKPCNVLGKLHAIKNKIYAKCTAKERGVLALKDTLWTGVISAVWLHH